MSWFGAISSYRWGFLVLSFGGAAVMSSHCAGTTTTGASSVGSTKPTIIAKTAVRGELAPGTATPPPSATTVVIPVREQELREGFAARQYFISCFHEDLRRDRSAGGHITLRFDITPSGALEKLEVAERTGTFSEEFVTCLSTGVLKVTLEARPGSEPVRLTYPFSFSSQFSATAGASAAPSTLSAPSASAKP